MNITYEGTDFLATLKNRQKASGEKEKIIDLNKIPEIQNYMANHNNELSMEAFLTGLFGTYQARNEVFQPSQDISALDSCIFKGGADSIINNYLGFHEIINKYDDAPACFYNEEKFEVFSDIIFKLNGLTFKFLPSVFLLLNYAHSMLHEIIEIEGETPEPEKYFSIPDYKIIIYEDDKQYESVGSYSYYYYQPQLS